MNNSNCILNHDSMGTNTLLICPICNKSIPELEFHYSQSQMNISLKCKCLNENKLFALKEFINQMIQKQAEEKQCSNIHTQNNKAEKYCQECAVWFCKDCLNNLHNEYNKKHTLTDYELNVICVDHGHNYTQYCNECLVNICTECSIGHKDHTLINIEAITVNEDNAEYFETIFQNNKEIIESFIKRLNVDSNESHKEMKEDIERVYVSNKNINEELKVLYRLYINTVKTFLNYQLYQLTKLSHTLTINKYEFKIINSKNIDELFLDISVYLQSNYLLTQINNNKKCLMTFYGHDHNIFCICQLKNGLIASGSGDKTIRLWNIETNKCKYTLTGHAHSVCCLVQLRDNRLVSGSYKTIKFWNTETYKCENTIMNAHQHFSYSMIQIKDGRVVTASEDNTTKIWDITTYQCTTTISDEISSSLCVIELHDGRLACSLCDATIIIFNAKVNKLQTIVTGHNKYVKCIIQLTDGRLVSGSYKSAKVFNAISQKCEITLIGHNNFVFCLCELKNGILATGSGDNTIKYWNLKSNECLATLIEHSWYVYGFVRLSNGKLASGSYDNTVKIWDV